jgi:CHAT domain-containing protein/tetratricopeptide (TPR) repeat protein
MRLPVLIVGSLFFLLVSLSGRRSSSPVAHSTPESIWLNSPFTRQRVEGTKALRAGEYRRAVSEFSSGAIAAARARDHVSHGRFLANQAGALMMLGENRRAIDALLAARQSANAAGDLLTLQGAEANLSSLYVLTGDYESAAEAAARGAAIHPPKQDPEQRIRTLSIFGRAVAKATSPLAAEPYFREALSVASSLGSLSLEADVLELWAYESGQSPGGYDDWTGEMFARAWWKRRAARDPRIVLTEARLARQFRERGQWAAARRWSGRVESAVARGARIPLPEWMLRADEAAVDAGDGRTWEALAGYRHSLALAEKWRVALPPVERLRLGAERRRLNELVEGYLQTAARLQARAPDPLLAAEMFAVIQYNRAWSLDGNSPATLTPLHDQARQLESRLLAGDRSADSQLRSLRAAIVEQTATSPAAHPGDSGSPTLAPPAPGEAILTFWLHDEGSWLWLWTSTGLKITPLPSRPQLLSTAARFAAAVARDGPDAPALGHQLRAALLGRLEKQALAATRWQIVADDGLFAVPFAALPTPTGRFLVESTEISLTPNARRRPPSPPAAKRFFALADPVFNPADERREQPWTWLRRVQASHYASLLPRLPGTRPEAESAQRTWRAAGFDTALYTGPAAGEQPVLDRLSEWQPGIVHLATHTVFPPGDSARPRIALSLRPDGSPGLLAAEDIAALRLNADLVVMSACRSAGADYASGAGLLGLTRSWLAAGARQVLATLWPVGDDATAFFQTFHGHLAAGGNLPAGAPSALRQAQLAALRAGGPAASPRHWAGYVVLSRR